MRSLKGNRRASIPGPRSRALAQCLEKFEVPTVTCLSPQAPIFWKRARGHHVWDVDGNRYIDLTSAFGVASLGHSHPGIVEAIRGQAKLLSHAMGDVYPSELKAKLCERLSHLTFGRWTRGKISGQTFLCNSGFEAVEVAMKTARLFTQKRGVLVFRGGYHGLGYGALEVTWREDFKKPFCDQLGRFAVSVFYPTEASFRAKDPLSQNRVQMERFEEEVRRILSEYEIGAILVEPIQGRGGERIPPFDFLPRLRELCDKRRMLLMVDEIYTGLWRTGRWFAVEHQGVVPDLVCMGKALTGCLPMSACVGKQSVMAAWPRSQGEALHTSTFLGNPLACAAALRSLEEFEKVSQAEDIEKKGTWFLELLRKRMGSIPGVVDIRGKGMMLGIEIDRRRGPFAERWMRQLLARGIIVLPSGGFSLPEVLSLTPPLTIPRTVLKGCIDPLAEVFEEGVRRV